MKQGKKSGSVVLFAIGALVLLAILGASIPYVVGDASWQAASPDCALQARLMAEGGMRRAMALVNGGTDPLDLDGQWFDAGGGTRVSYRVTDSGTEKVVVSVAEACMDMGRTTASAEERLAIPSSSGSGIPDLDEEADKFVPVDSGTGAVAVDNDPSDPSLLLGNGKSDSFGAVWYAGDRKACAGGSCAFGHGIRSRFDALMAPAGSGDGIVFAVMNAVLNTSSSVGGSPGMGELLGYAGPGVDGLGIRPPKIGVEIDPWQNACNANACAAESRCDTSDHVAVVAWGDDVYGCHDSYDDNRHGAGDNGKDVSSSGWDGVMTKPDGWLTSGRTVRMRVEIHRSLVPDRDGLYCYLVKGWAVREDQPEPAGYDDLASDFEGEPDVEKVIRLTGQEHARFESFRFGLTQGTGAIVQRAEVRHLKLDFRDPPEPMPSNGLVGSWDFSSPSSLWREATGNVLGGSVKGDLQSIPGVGCPACGGVYGSGLVSVPDQSALDLRDSGTVSLWIRPDRLDDFAGLVHKGGSDSFSDEAYSLQIWTDRKLFLSIGSPYASATVTSPSLPASIDGGWHHVAGTWDRDRLSIYLDGALIATAANVHGVSAQNSSGSLQIGSQLVWGIHGTLPFTGGMDQVRLYRRSLTPGEIAVLSTER